MSIREIPKSYRYDCDAKSCAFFHIQEHANGHYVNSRPKGWMRLLIYSDVNPMEPRDILLCHRCTDKMEQDLDEILA